MAAATAVIICTGVTLIDCPKACVATSTGEKPGSVGRRKMPGRFAVQADARQLTESEGIKVVLEGGSPEPLFHEDGAGIDAVLEHPGHRLRAVNRIVPVLQRNPGDRDFAGVHVGRVGSHHSIVNRPGGGHDFHHAAGLVQVRHRAIAQQGQRSRVVQVQRAVLEAGHGRVSEDLAALRVHDDDVAALRLVLCDRLGQRVLGHLLNVPVNRQLDILARDRVDGVVFAVRDRLVGRVSLVDRFAGFALEDFVVGVFDTCKAGVVGAGDAEDGGADVAIRVHALRILLGDDPGHACGDQLVAEVVIHVALDQVVDRAAGGSIRH